MDYSKENNKKRKRKEKSQGKKITNKIALLFFRAAAAAMLIVFFALAGAGIGAYLGILQNSPVIDLPTVQPNIYSSFILCSRTGEVIETLKDKENRVYVPFRNIPENLKNAFIAIEDERFYSHNGVDIRSMGRAVYKALLSGGKDQEGASTITQQLIKNRLGKSTNSLITKLQEQYIAVQFEKRLSEPDNLGSKQAAKDYILESYLNTINLGRGYFGVQTAARNYYNKDVSDLTLAECATIACITQNPSKYPPDLRPENNKIRAAIVLDKMLELGMISEAEYKEAINEPVYDHVITGALNLDGAGPILSYFNDALIQSVNKDLQKKYGISENEAYDWIYNRGLQIYSTQDIEMQKVVDDVFLDDANFPQADFEIDVEYRLSVKNNITGKTTNYNRKRTVKKLEDVDAFIESVKDDLLTANDDILGEVVIKTSQPQASFVLLDYHNGHVKAISGGRGEKPVNMSFNRAIDAMRSPGSQFKVLASYAPAIDLGQLSPASIIEDLPYVYEFSDSQPPYIPRNWWGGSYYEGIATVRRGIYRSMNILAVKCFIDVGIETGFSYLQNFGFSTLVTGETRPNGRYYSDLVPSLTLGGMTDGVKTIELCAAYGVIANGGDYNKPIFYTKVLDHDGNILLENTPDPKPVIKPTSAYLLTDMMRDTVRVGTGTRAAFSNSKMPIAGKTGTSTDTVDLGFTGYTPYYVGTLWLGFDQQKKIRDDNGPHLRLWRMIMEGIHQDLPVKEFERPDGILTVTICRDSGMLPSPLCERDRRGSRVYSDIFAAGMQPTDVCTVHREMLIDTSTNLRAGINCPPGEVELRVGIVRQDPYVGDPVNILDADFEFTQEMINGPECIYHNIPGGSGNWMIPPDNIYDQNNPNSIIPMPAPDDDDDRLPDGGNNWGFITDGLG